VRTQNATIVRVSQPTITAEHKAIDSDLAKELIEEVQAEYVIRYGGPDATPVDPQEFAGPQGAFMVLSVDGEPAGMVGLRRHNAADVEVKRMFVRSKFRGRGLSRELMAWAEEQARGLGYRRVVLETGLQQPEAIGLYESSGYQEIPGFGHYKDSPLNRCYAKTLD
jgi:GNAT superfamily N-acetyltransferase